LREGQEWGIGRVDPGEGFWGGQEAELGGLVLADFEGWPGMRLGRMDRLGRVGRGRDGGPLDENWPRPDRPDLLHYSYI